MLHSHAGRLPLHPSLREPGPQQHAANRQDAASHMMNMIMIMMMMATSPFYRSRSRSSKKKQ